MTAVSIAETSEGEATQNKRRALIVMGALCAMFLVSVLYHAPDGDYFTICAFKNAVGLPCPGCGLVHSFCALGKGHVASAFEFNLVGPFLFLSFFLWWVWSIFTLSGLARPAEVLETLGRRIRPAKVFMWAFVIFGVGRIFYILLFQRELLEHSPLVALFKRFFG